MHSVYRYYCNNWLSQKTIAVLSNFEQNEQNYSKRQLAVQTPWCGDTSEKQPQKRQLKSFKKTNPTYLAQPNPTVTGL